MAFRNAALVFVGVFDFQIRVCIESDTQCVIITYTALQNFN
jgi:hypothetical protein